MRSFPEGKKEVLPSSPNGGGDFFQLLVDNFYRGIGYSTLEGRQVALQKPTGQYSPADLQPLIESNLEQKKIRRPIRSIDGLKLWESASIATF